MMWATAKLSSLSGLENLQVGSIGGGDRQWQRGADVPRHDSGSVYELKRTAI
ncbi:hypothetical protein [Lyngbya confervoides]|uniref:Uncharacterized protein n=1 Tax=Lyngbya confervoides BDU141951 TaxID=1574623 RepID=A0ABD4SZH6_9CYAN|nr:hypothetical protein [Lyngbya confervoides]MCM1981872.1 hypothetical protein [Lyngbya confervoides BDU141951]